MVELIARGTARQAYAVYRTGVQHPQLNGVIQLEAATPNAITQVARQLRDVPSLWWIGPDSYTEAGRNVFHAGGRAIGKVPVMALRLSDLSRELTLPTDVTMALLDENEDLTPWVQCYSGPMGVEEKNFFNMFRAERCRSDRPGQLNRFAARCKGEIVGTSELFSHAGVAGIYLVSTKKTNRRRGISTALTQADCIMGFERSLKVATLQASSSGHPVYRKMGFRDVAFYELHSFPAILD